MANFLEVGDGCAGIANYGTKMRFDGIDLLQPIDRQPDEKGNYNW